MGRGYLFGCLLSLLLYKFDRNRVFRFIDIKLNSLVKSNFIKEMIYFIIIAILYFPFLYLNLNDEFINFLVAFLVIDISNSERKALKLNEKMRFYEAIETMTKSLLCGFFIPLFLIIAFKNNYPTIIYFVIYNITEITEYKVINVIFKIIIIIPSIILQGILYFIYVFRNKQYKLNFKGEYFHNLIEDPCLNLNITASYIEKVNYCKCYKFRDASYIKNYGNYNERINEGCVKDYISISYGVAFFIFAVFFMVIYFL